MGQGRLPVEAVRGGGDGGGDDGGINTEAMRRTARARRRRSWPQKCLARQAL